jgi:flagellar motor switch protein FliN
MKNHRELLKSYAGEVELLLPIIADTFKNIVQREVQLSHAISNENEINTLIPNSGYPKVCITFTAGSASLSHRNLFVLQPQLVSAAYAAMIGEEAPRELSDEHLEGLNEIIQQLLGQIKSNVSNDNASYVLHDLKVFKANSEETLSQMASNTDGLYSDFTLKGWDEPFVIQHFCWVTANNQETRAKGKNMSENRETDRGAGAAFASVDVQPVEFGALNGNNMEYEIPRNVDMLMDVDLELSVELDRKTVLVSDLLKLGKGSIVELEKSAGEPLDIFVNGRKFAEGEVVVIDDRFGIRITQLISPKERVKSLG